jgi:hypothetical protein
MTSITTSTSTHLTHNAADRTVSDGGASIDSPLKKPIRKPFRPPSPVNWGSGPGASRNNPFDITDDFPQTKLRDVEDIFATFPDPTSNPFDNILATAGVHISSGNNNNARITRGNSESLNNIDGVQYVSDQGESGDECSIDSEDEEERKKRLTPRGSDLKRKYFPGQDLDPTAGSASRGRNRAVMFMETAAPPAHLVECKLLILENGLKFDFVHVATGRVWMRAQRRTDGLKSRLNPAAAVHFPIWVSPGLLVENFGNGSPPGISSKSPDSVAGSSSGGGVEDFLSFSEVMRELEAATVLQNESTTTETELRMGKLKSDPRQTHFQLWGTGLSAREAIGKLHARPEFFALKMESKSLAKLVIPAPGAPRPRPLTKSEYLLKRASKNDPTTKILVGARTPSVWSFGVEGGKDAMPDLRVIRTQGSTSLAVEFRNLSPFQAFGIAIACVSSGLRPNGMGGSQSNLLPSGSSTGSGTSGEAVQRKESWSSLLTRKVSFNKANGGGGRRGSLGSIGEPSSPSANTSNNGLPPKPLGRKSSLPDTFT